MRRTLCSYLQVETLFHSLTNYARVWMMNCCSSKSLNSLRNSSSKSNSRRKQRSRRGTGRTSCKPLWKETVRRKVTSSRVSTTPSWTWIRIRRNQVSKSVHRCKRSPLKWQHLIKWTTARKSKNLMGPLLVRRIQFLNEKLVSTFFFF